MPTVARSTPAAVAVTDGAADNGNGNGNGDGTEAKEKENGGGLYDLKTRKRLQMFLDVRYIRVGVLVGRVCLCMCVCVLYCFAPVPAFFFVQRPPVAWFGCCVVRCG